MCVGVCARTILKPKRGHVSKLSEENEILKQEAAATGPIDQVPEVSGCTVCVGGGVSPEASAPERRCVLHAPCTIATHVEPISHV